LLVVGDGHCNLRIPVTIDVSEKIDRSTSSGCTPILPTVENGPVPPRDEPNVDSIQRSRVHDGEVRNPIAGQVVTGREGDSEKVSRRSKLLNEAEKEEN